MPGTGGTNGAEPVASTTDIVSDLAAVGGTHHPFVAVDLGDAIADEQVMPRSLVPLRRRQREFLGLAMLEVFGEIDAIVSGPRFLAERHDLELVLLIELDEALAEAMPHHAVADDHHRLRSFTDHAQSLHPTISY